MEDNGIPKHIKRPVHEAEHLYSKPNLTDEEVARLHRMQIELDQCWDSLRQRRALRHAGQNPADAKIRPPDVVENYKQ